MTVIYLLAAMVMAAPEPASSPVKSIFHSNRFCGPMSVQRVLDYYGQSVEAIDLVRELQWPDVEKGSSFAGLSKVLESRGIRTLAVDVAMGDAAWDWREPLILQLRDAGQDHFVVWLPPGPDQPARIWDSSDSPALRLFGYRGFFTGAVLITSRDPIPAALSITKVSHRMRWYFVAICGCIGTLLGVFVGKYLQDSKSSPPKTQEPS